MAPRVESAAPERSHPQDGAQRNGGAQALPSCNHFSLIGQMINQTLAGPRRGVMQNCVHRRWGQPDGDSNLPPSLSKSSQTPNCRARVLAHPYEKAGPPKMPPPFSKTVSATNLPPPFCQPCRADKKATARDCILSCCKHPEGFGLRFGLKIKNDHREGVTISEKGAGWALVMIEDVFRAI